MFFASQTSGPASKSFILFALLLIAMAGVIRAQSKESVLLASDRLTRRLGSPLIPMGPAGSIDDDKTGPRVVLKFGPTDYRMWYEAVPAPNRSKVGYAVSRDGLTWTKLGSLPTLDPSQGWEGGPDGEVSPNSILIENGIYKLWYHSFGVDEKRRIGYATSNDGLTWVKHPTPVLDVGAPGSLEGQYVTEPRVFRIGSEYRMYYTANAVGDIDIGRSRWFYATSPDGINWTRRGQLWARFSDAGYGIVFDGTTWHAWYGVAFQSLHYASSRDGLTWTDGPNNPVLVVDANQAAFDSGGIGDSVSAYKDGFEYRIMYTGGRFNSFGRNESIMLATVSTIGCAGYPYVRFSNVKRRCL